MKTLRITKKKLCFFIVGFSLPFIILGVTSNVFGTWYNGGVDWVMNGGRVINLQDPTSDDMPVTKNYADSYGGAHYEGVTSTAINGNFGGLDDANKMCDGNYSGSHMCTVDEIIRSGRSSSLTYAWVLCGIQYGSSCHTPIDTVDSGGSRYGSCAGFSSPSFTTSSSSYKGFVFGGTGSVSAVTCDSTYKIHCCS